MNTVHDDWLDRELRRSLGREEEQPAPEFASVMQAAEQRNSRNRMRYRVVAATAVIGSAALLVFAQWPNNRPITDDEFLIADALLDATYWTAPSDVLMPQHQFDIYQDMPVFGVSTESEEGTLL